MKNVFPNVKTIASYLPLGQYIQLNNYTSKEFTNIRTPKTTLEAKKLSIYYHEVQHWLDHHYTLWGLRNLALICNAYSAKASHSENLFKHIRTLSLELRKEMFNDYYSETYNSITGNFSQRWRYNYSSGIRYNLSGEIDESKPLLFVKFTDHLGAKPVARVPVSVLALLETKAMYAESVTMAGYINGLPAPNKKMEEILFSKESEQWIYNPDLCVYNVAVHIAANCFNITDVAIALRLSSLISSIALNVPRSLYLNIKIPSGTEDWKQRPEAMLKSYDVGFIFWCFCRNAAEAKIDAKIANVNDILHASGLGNEQTLKISIKKELGEVQQSILPGPFGDLYKTLGSRFHDFLTEFGLNPEPSKKLLASRYFLENPPAVVCQDSAYTYADDDAAALILDRFYRFGSMDFPSYFALTHYFEEKFEEFDSVCGV